MLVFAAVDIGSNSVRLSIAELRKRRLEPKYQDREVTRLGEEVFRTGNLAPAAMAHTLRVLRRFHRAAQSHGVNRTRVVATSAMRDCNNYRIFANWVKEATGWKVEVISGQEEGRLIHLGVVDNLSRRPSPLVLIDVGGGSCELTLSEKGHIQDIVSLPLGAVRLTQEFIRNDPPDKLEMKRLSDYIAEELERYPRRWSSFSTKVAIATSGTAAALAGAAQFLGLASNTVTRQATESLEKWLVEHNNRERAAIKGINPKRAEIVVAGAAVYARLLKTCGIRSFRYSPLGLRDGILSEMAAEYDQNTRSRRQLEFDREDVLLKIGRRYRVDRANAEHVRMLAWSLFDQLRPVHTLNAEFREWIGAAALLYEVGAFVNPSGQHRHANYIISSSELLGFTPLQRRIIGAIARFQGKSGPKRGDELIESLPEELRWNVIKSTALLRVARALNQGRRHSVRKLRVTNRNGHITIGIHRGPGRPDLELWAGEKEIPYFREVFGRELAFKLL